MAAAALGLLLALGLGWAGMVASSDEAGAAVTALNPRNAPVGIAQGIFPGRVVWDYDPAATPWDGRTGYWWQDHATNQDAVDGMLSRTVRALTGEYDEAGAWDALFRWFNQSRGNGDVGYQPGETVAIKVNLNNHNRSYGEADQELDASPHAILALLRQLVHKAGVLPQDIVVYDAVRLIPDKIYVKCHAEFPQVVFADRLGTNGRTKVQWSSPVIAYSTSTWPDGSPCGSRIPQRVLSATYIINMALLKCHGTTGVTLTSKNHYGSIDGQEHWYIQARSREVPLYSPLVDLIGHRHLGGKTMLFLIDALYGTSQHNGVPKRFQRAPFNNRWSSSLFASQDPVAIDSVGLDFLASEFPSKYLLNADNFLREAALAANPPSGTRYDPEGDGTRLGSLGVHEHWNDDNLRQYTRNLGSGAGIELVAIADDPMVLAPIRVEPGAVAVPAAAGAGRQVNVMSRIAWTAETDTAWLEITRGASGTTNGPIEFAVGENNSLSARAGHIRVGGGGFARTCTVMQAGMHVPYPAGIAHAVPGVVEMENFDGGGEGLALHDTTVLNEGGVYRPYEGVDIWADAALGNGHAVGGVRPGEWLEYTVQVETAGTFRLLARLAAAGGGGQFRVRVDSVEQLGMLNVPDTEEQNAYQTMNCGLLELYSGIHTVRVEMVTAGPRGVIADFDWLDFRTQVPPPAGNASIGDFGGDAVADPTVFRPADGLWNMFFSEGWNGSEAFGWSAVKPVPADYDGDGIVDVAVYHPATGNWYIRQSTNGQTRVEAFGWNATIPLPGDYDGDGVADLAVFHQASARWFFRMSGGGADAGVAFGWPAVIPVPADYDGDGAVDVAVYHPASGNWYFCESSTGEVIVVPWGWATAVPVPADYDGDGTADIAVFHRKTANWYIRFSGGGDWVLGYGWSSVIPVAADYDGDGKADIAVYHPTGGKWYIRKSSSGTTDVLDVGGPNWNSVWLYSLIHSWFNLP